MVYKKRKNTGTGISSGAGGALILGIDTSCDDTAVAVIRMKPTDISDNTGYAAEMLSSVIMSQNHIHASFGGIVPELAGREHLLAISAAVKQAMNDAGTDLSGLSLIAVTRGPGLMGSLLVGLGFGSALALGSSTPFVGVNHLAGHVHSLRLLPNPPETPFIALVVSGGHTMLVKVERGYRELATLAATRDDAAGEAFDKVARLLELGYPGGPVIQKAARTGTAGNIQLPRPMLNKGLDFSFSGLKTAVIHRVMSLKPEQPKSVKQESEISRKQIWLSNQEIADMAAEFQEAVADILVSKLLEAAQANNVTNVAISGGVAANQRLRERLDQEAARKGVSAFMPPVKLCTDNAAMIACAGHFYSQLLDCNIENIARHLEVRPEWQVDCTGPVHAGSRR